MSGPPVPVVGRRAVKVRETDHDSFNLDFDLEDDGRIPVCESCCNATTCNNGGACGVSGSLYQL